MTKPRLAKKIVPVQYHRLIAIFILFSVSTVAQRKEPLFIAPVYIEYTSVTTEEFAKEVRALRERIGPSATAGGDVLVGFSTFLDMRLRHPRLDEAIDRSVVQPTLDNIDLIVERARSNELPVHISLSSGFFHGANSLRDAAIKADVRNAQWFSDGWIGLPDESVPPGEVPRSAWLTPSRYAQPLRKRIEESVSIVGAELAAAIQRYPETVHSISGDTEVELSFARNLDSEGRARTGGQVLLADYSPFMIAEFRDWIRHGRYEGDHAPGSDDNHDGHTFNQDFHQNFRTWQLRYFDDSGPIPYDQYRAMRDKLPKTGRYFIDGGFDAPRAEGASGPAGPSGNDAFWQSWKQFRVAVVSNYLHDFAEWIALDSRIPASRFYTHQIPAEFLFGGKESARARLETSASPLDTAFIKPLTSPGITVFDTYNGKTWSKTSGAALFQRLERSGENWGILEYSPSVPASPDDNYYLGELRALSSFHPAIIAPFAWTNEELHNVYRIQNTAYETALRKFVQEIRK